MKKHISLEPILFAIGFSWCMYSLIVSVLGNCELYLEEKNGKWYVLHTESETDELGTRDYELTDFGPISEKEANKIVSECQEHAKTWLKSYGTIYWFVYSTGFYFELSLMIFLFPLGGIWLVNKIYQQKPK